MTDTPPRDDPQCDEVCDHDWRTYDGPWRPYEGATNVRTCANCVAVAWDSRMAPMPGEDEVVLESADGRRWTRTERGWLEHRFDQPVPLTPELLDPVANLRAVQEWVKAKYLGAEPRSPYLFASDNVTIVPDASPPLRKFWGEEAERIGERLDAERVLEIARGQDADRDRLDEFRVALTRGERWPLDRLTDPMVELMWAEIDMLRNRHTPDVHERQGAALANQAMEIGDLPGQIAYRIRAELVCCDAYDVHGRLDASDEIEPPHAICYWGEAAARIAEGRSDDDTPETT